MMRVEPRTTAVRRPGGRIFRGALWNYTAQAATIFIQFGYAGVTSRHVPAAGFGIYAVSLAVVGFVTLLATGGLGQTVNRLHQLDRPSVNGLQTYALVLGFAGAIFVLCTAGIWADLWGNPEAESTIRLLSMLALMAPSTALATGVLRRKGLFRRLSFITILANVVGMCLGVFAVLVEPSARALIFSPVLAQLFLLVGSTLSDRSLLVGFASLGKCKEALGFSQKLTVASVLSYVSSNLIKIGFSHAHGGSAFGAWNRAEVLALVPFQQSQTAIIQAVYPEFRHDIHSSERAHRVWTDLLILVSSFILPVSVLAAIILPRLTSVLFGAGWETSERLVGFLAIAGGTQVVAVVLSSAVESLGRFRWIWSTELLLIAFQTLGVVAVFHFSSIFIAPVVLIFTNVLRHTWQVWLCSNAGYVDAAALSKHYFRVVAISLLVGIAAWVILWLPADDIPISMRWGIFSGAALCALWAGWKFRRHSSIFRIAESYGLLPASAK